MISLKPKDFTAVRLALRDMICDAPAVKTERWQGVPVNTDTLELRNVNFEINLLGDESLDYWRQDIQPNLPWADDHFLERVGGEPINPGIQWAKWPYGQNARKFKEQGRFNHNYMERLWPKYARRTDDGSLPIVHERNIRKYPVGDSRPKFGIAWHYGDLQDFVELLAKEPYTRQAWIPLFFPEDTGLSDGGRKMCSLGYQVLVRDHRAHIWYPLRSCDLIRHWADDCYLAVRMLLWVIDRCREINPYWKDIKPGSYAMHMTSLHVFVSDVDALEQERAMADEK